MLHVWRPEQEIRNIYISMRDSIKMWPDEDGFFQKHEKELRSTNGAVSCMCFLPPYHIAIGTTQGIITLHDILHDLDEYQLVPCICLYSSSILGWCEPFAGGVGVTHKGRPENAAGTLQAHPPVRLNTSSRQFVVNGRLKLQSPEHLG